MNVPVAVAVTARMAALRLAIPGALYRLPRPIPWRLVPLDDAAPTLSGSATTAVLVLDGLAPGTRYRFAAAGFEALDLTTRPCAGLVTASGLVPDTAPDDLAAAEANARALARAATSVPAGGTLLLPPGVWTALPVALGSHMTFRLSEGAVLRAPSRRDGWPILPARDAGGAMLGSWEGLPDACFAAPLHAIGAASLVIEGRGVLDGSGDLGDWWSWPKETRSGARRPRGLHLIGCRDVTLLGFTIRNAASWTLHPQGCDQLVAAGLDILAPHDSPNTDGFNPESCRDVTIEGVRFSVGDDCIAVKAGKRGPQGEADHLAETRHVRVRHCLMERGHGGLVIGSEMSGGVHDVAIEDCEMIGTDRGLRLKTRRGRGGTVSAIAMRRVLLDGVQTAVSANAHYYCDADGHDAWVQSRAPAPLDAGTPQIDGVTVEDVEIRGLAHAAGCFLGLAEAPITGIRIRRLRIASLDPAAEPRPPIMADDIRPMRHETLTHEQARIDCDDPGLLSQTPVSVLPERVDQ